MCLHFLLCFHSAGVCGSLIPFLSPVMPSTHVFFFPPPPPGEHVHTLSDDWKNANKVRIIFLSFIKTERVRVTSVTHNVVP